MEILEQEKKERIAMDIIGFSVQRLGNMVSRLNHLSVRIKEIMDINKNYLTKEMLSLPMLKEQFKIAMSTAKSSGKIVSITPSNCYNEGVCPVAKT